MNFLELCQATARESGTITGLPSFTTVADASGRVLKLVNWVADAWTQIQNSRVDWLFRQGEFSHALIVGQPKYTGASFDIEASGWLPDIDCRRSMSLYDPDIGQADEGIICQLSYENWRSLYDFGAQTSNRPTTWASAPDGQLCIGAKPDKAYVLRGRYRKKAQVLALDGDVPIIPEEFHNTIVAQALRNMADSDEFYEGLIPKAQKFEAVGNALVIDQTPAIDSF